MQKEVTISEEELSALTERVNEIQASAKELDAQIQNGEELPYVPTDGVSFGFSGGPQGAQIQGWVTYTPTNKLYCYGNGRQISGWPASGATAAPGMFVLHRELLLNAKIITWRAKGSGLIGSLHLVADGKPVTIIPLVTVGAGFLDWEIAGTCKFRVG